MSKASGGDGILPEQFQILKGDTVKCCTQYASKFGKLSSGHRSGKGQFSSQSQRKAMPKNVQITVQLYSFHMLAGFLGKSAGKESACNAGDPGSIPGSGDPVEKDRLPTPVFLGFHGDSVSRESICNWGDLGLIPRLGRSPGGGHRKTLQCSCLENLHRQRSLVGYSP